MPRAESVYDALRLPQLIPIRASKLSDRGVTASEERRGQRWTGEVGILTGIGSVGGTVREAATTERSIHARLVHKPLSLGS